MCSLAQKNVISKLATSNSLNDTMMSLNTVLYKMVVESVVNFFLWKWVIRTENREEKMQQGSI